MIDDVENRPSYERPSVNLDGDFRRAGDPKLSRRGDKPVPPPRPGVPACLEPQDRWMHQRDYERDTALTDARASMRASKRTSPARADELALMAHDKRAERREKSDKPVTHKTYGLRERSHSKASGKRREATHAKRP